MTDEQTQQLKGLIGKRNPVKVTMYRPEKLEMTPSVVLQRFGRGTVEASADGMVCRFPGGIVLSIEAAANG